MSTLSLQSTRFSDNVQRFLLKCNVPSSFENGFSTVKHEMNERFKHSWKSEWDSLTDQDRHRLFLRFHPHPLLESIALTSDFLVSYFFPTSFSKDIPILEYKIGQPISLKDAERAFIEPVFHPRVLQSLPSHVYRSQQRKMFDIIQMQWMDLSEFVQLRNTDEFLSRSVFQSLLHQNKTIWCGKQNVGFKSPVSGTLFGNLVSFNYDHQQFFPQKKGRLRCQQIRNLSQIPSQLKPSTLVPSHYWRCSYFQYTFYLPDTNVGRLVLCLMKDCFKKGNLFAFHHNRRIRHGRIHKKTTLSGIYGYPDDTYLDRVLGELNQLGSTPYLYQFSADPSFLLEQDPYPKETRFQLEFEFLK